MKLCVSILLLFVTRGIESLECYQCSDVSSINNCLTTTLCRTGQSCFTNSVTSDQSTSFTMGCISNEQCGVQSPLVGRGISERQTQCHECCSTERCNNQLCVHYKPTTCIDDPKVDCAYMNAMFNICKDIHHSKTVCPKFCGLCNLVDGNWAEWTQWSVCDVTCENGIQTRKRTCTNPAPAHKGLDCAGNSTDVRGCIKQPCPIHGGWTKWSSWGQCSVTCDTGMQKRNRTCTNPYPSRFGDHCFGDDIEDRLCMPRPCANGGWSKWGEWTNCSAVCDGGLRTRSRNCTNPVPSPHGMFCIGDTSETESCGIKSCTPNVVFNAYQVSDLSPAVGQTMIFTNILVNEGNGYSNSTGEFTAPVDGIYSFSAQMCFGGGVHLYFDIKIGGRTYASAYAYNANAALCALAQTSARVRKNEKVIVQWTTTAYTSNYVVQNSYYRNFFTGHLVHAIN